MWPYGEQVGKSRKLQGLHLGTMFHTLEARALKTLARLPHFKCLRISDTPCATPIHPDLLSFQPQRTDW